MVVLRFLGYEVYMAGKNLGIVGEHPGTSDDATGCRNCYTKPMLSHSGCSGKHASTTVSWAGTKTPPPGKSMFYQVALPGAENDVELDLSRMCSHVHRDLPQKSCMITMDHVIGGQPVRSTPTYLGG